MDVHSPEKRSYNMSRIKGKDTKPEIMVRRWLWSKGYHYRLHRKDLPGKPDIVFPGRKKAIFVHGCFWHKHECKYFKWPQTNPEFWEEKINRNIVRDQRNYRSLDDKGWRYFIIWECELKSADRESLWRRLESFLEKT